MAKIILHDDDKTVEAHAGDKIVDICEANDSSIMFGCTNGVCGTCKSKILKGMEHLSDISEEERDSLENFGAEEGERLLCLCKVKDEESEIEIQQN